MLSDSLHPLCVPLLTPLSEAVRSAPSVLYLPGLERWWREAADPGLREALLTSLVTLPATSAVLVLGTYEEGLGDEQGGEAERNGGGVEDLPKDLIRIFAPTGTSLLTAR